MPTGGIGNGGSRLPCAAVTKRSGLSSRVVCESASRGLTPCWSASLRVQRLSAERRVMIACSNCANNLIKRLLMQVEPDRCGAQLGQDHHQVLQGAAEAIDRPCRCWWHLRLHGVVQRLDPQLRMASTPNSVNAINALCDTRQRIPAMPCIRWGSRRRRGDGFGIGPAVNRITAMNGSGSASRRTVSMPSIPDIITSSKIRRIPPAAVAHSHRLHNLPCTLVIWSRQVVGSANPVAQHRQYQTRGMVTVVKDRLSRSPQVRVRPVAAGVVVPIKGGEI